MIKQVQVKSKDQFDILKLGDLVGTGKGIIAQVSAFREKYLLITVDRDTAGCYWYSTISDSLFGLVQKLRNDNFHTWEKLDGELKFIPRDKRECCDGRSGP